MSLPEKWCIKQNTSQEVCDWFNKKYDTFAFLDGGYSYLVNTENFINYDNLYQNEIPEGYKEITLEEFERYILNKQLKYSIKDLSEGKVAMKYDEKIDYKEDAALLLKLAFNDNQKFYGFNTYYFKDVYEFNQWGFSHNTNLPTQPLKDFLMKKIIGYKLIKAYPSSEKVGTILTEFNCPWVDYTEFFELVYEEEFKVGDYVTVTKIPEKDHWIINEKNRTFKLLSTTKFFSCDANNNTSKNCYGLEDCEFRKATQEEIDSVTKIMLPNSKYEIKIEETFAYTEATAKISDYWFNKQFWQAAKVIAEHPKADVIVGCGAKDTIGSSNQWKLDLETIQKVLDRL